MIKSVECAPIILPRSRFSFEKSFGRMTKSSTYESKAGSAARSLIGKLKFSVEQNRL
jgi:hypothetical protein